MQQSLIRLRKYSLSKSPRFVLLVDWKLAASCENIGQLFLTIRLRTVYAKKNNYSTQTTVWNRSKSAFRLRLELQLFETRRYSQLLSFGHISKVIGPKMARMSNCKG